jgi:hypothetical protein
LLFGFNNVDEVFVGGWDFAKAGNSATGAVAR